MAGQDEPYFVDIIGFGDAVDIMPLVHEAISICPYEHDFTPIEIAKLTEQAVRGKYVPVDILDRIEDRMLGALTGTVINWVQSEHRINQLRDPDLHRLRPFIKLDYFDDMPPCAAGRHLRDRWLEPEELVRIPLDGCDAQVCHCTYQTCGWIDFAERHPDWPLSQLAEPSVLPPLRQEAGKQV